jgi:hypothetical protein
MIALAVNMTPLLVVMIQFCTLALGVQHVVGAPRGSYNSVQFIGFGVSTDEQTWLLKPYFKSDECKNELMDAVSKMSESTTISSLLSRVLRTDYVSDCLLVNPKCEGKNPGTYTEFSDLDLKQFFAEDEKFGMGGIRCYTGNVDIENDVLGRLDVMEKAVAKAYTYSNASSTVLKVFIAPEFFFRGPYGAYNFSSIFPVGFGEEFNAINEIGRGLRRISQNSSYDDWLFVFGTIVAMDSNTSTMVSSSTVGQESDTGYQFGWLNFAPVFKGGVPPIDASSNGMDFLVSKVYVSVLDFLTADRNPFDVSSNITQIMYNNIDWTEVQGWLESKAYTVVYDNLLFVNDILIAVEICADHAKRVAKSRFNEWMQDPANVTIPAGGDFQLYYPFSDTPPPGLPQLQLVTSDGMKIQNKSIILGPQGTILLQDGSVSPTVGLNATASGEQVRSDCYNKETGQISNLTLGSIPNVVFDIEIPGLSSYFSVPEPMSGNETKLTVFSAVPLGSLSFPGCSTCDADPGCPCAMPVWDKRLNECRRRLSI